MKFSFHTDIKSAKWFNEPFKLLTAGEVAALWLLLTGEGLARIPRHAIVCIYLYLIVTEDRASESGKAVLN